MKPLSLSAITGTLSVEFLALGPTLYGLGVLGRPGCAMFLFLSIVLGLACLISLPAKERP